MLILNCLPGPSIGPIEFNDPTCTILLLQLIDSIYITVKWPIKIGKWRIEGRFGKIDHRVRSQAVEGGLFLLFPRTFHIRIFYAFFVEL
jgi:hypothetical protein